MTKGETVVVVVEAAIAVILAVGIISLFNPILSDYRDLCISMSVVGGWGMENDQWKIDGYGNVSYETGRWVKPSTSCAGVTGSAKLTPQQMQELVAAVKRARTMINLWALKERYGLGIFDYFYTDVPTVDLYITVNGWSRHVSYQDPGCHYSVPQAVCDLRHEIEAVGRLAIPTSTP